MPLIEVTAGSPALPAGTYPATVIGISEKSLVTRYSKNGVEDDFLEWAWLVEGKDKDIEIKSLTTTATGPKSRVQEYLTALLGADAIEVGAGFEEEDLIGKKALVSTIVTEDGFAKIDRVTAMPAQSTRTVGQEARKVSQAAPADVEGQDDLPF